MFESSLIYNGYFWLCLMVLFFVLETVAVSGIFLSLGLASLMVGIVLFFFNLPFISLLSVIFISLMISYFIGVKIFKKFERKKKDDDEEPINN